MALPPIIRAPKGQNARGVGRGQFTAPGTYHQTAPARPVYVPPPSLSPQQHGGGTDIQSSGANYGSGQAARYKQTPAYRSAIAQVFAQQPVAAKAAIIRGLVRQNAFNTPEFHAVRGIWDHLPTSEMSQIPSLVPHEIGAFISGGEKGTLGTLLHSLPMEGTTAPGGSGLLAASTPFASGTLGHELATNTAKDAVNLPAETVSSVGLLGGDALSGNIGKLASDLVSGPAGFIEHPKTILQHPLDAYLTLAGPVHGAGSLIDRGARAATGRTLDRAPIALTGNLTRERPNYASSPFTRSVQKAIEKTHYQPAGDGGGAIVPRAENLKSRQIKAGVSQRIGMNERIRRVEIANQERAHAKAVLAPKRVRAAQAVKTAAKYNPAPAVIRGANVLSLIAQGVIRRPDTAVRDLATHLEKVKAERVALEGFPKALAEHDQYVKTLTKELNSWRGDKNLPRSLGPAFKAAEQHARDYAPLEKQAHAYGHFGKDVTPEMLQRRTLGAIVHEHMPGARFDPERQTMVVDTPHGTRVLTTTEMKKFADEQTHGRTLSYASHQAPKGDSAFYVSGQKFPAKAVQRNSMFAFRHGLTDPTHEALLEGRVHMQGVVSAHKSMGRNLGLLTEKRADGGYWRTYAEAKRDAPAGYVPVNVGRIHGYGEHVSPNNATHATSIEEEALRHSLDLNSRLQPSDMAGKWGLIHKDAVDQLRKHENQISPNTLLRGFRGTTTQFRKVALGTSAKHIPGVIQENLIRDIASGVFVHHWFAFRNVHAAAMKINPELAAERKIELGGGQVSGATRALATRQVSRHFAGTTLEGPLRGFEAFMRMPGPRQLSTAWNTWLRFAIDGTKRYLEETHQQAAVGKQLMQEFGGLMRLQGEAARRAAVHGYLDEATARRLRAGTERMFGKWTDLTPEAQTALMVSPFGMWWVNSVRWLGRLPVDHPMKTSVLAAASVGTEKQRQSLGLDMFEPGHLPLYEQGGIPSGGNIIAQNYYSPFGVANDPLETAQSLILPTITPQVLSALGDNWLGREMKSPQNPHGGETNPGQRAAVIVNSVLGSLVPFYQKAQTIATGGASQYDTSTLFNPQPKGNNPGPLAGLEKAFTPLRLYKNIGDKGSSSSSSGGGGGGMFGSGSSSGGGGGGLFGN